MVSVDSPSSPAECTSGTPGWAAASHVLAQAEATHTLQEPHSGPTTYSITASS
ncbi:hypothetical protein M878_42680 [Streptomyces roseochromogenus subsp. oscitans DS 12.976]|uniref:Uncharacterized protein n=1 Tax=Streptomyces roseochromogenus subsp. oscitans DS 12.976 TaxID=1352936 RepID=V6JH86_STRRC|nr:hypothetical protein M878_42680 [Streptomyces roseochromogenus subsp. oscitans DS 12.976]